MAFIGTRFGASRATLSHVNPVIIRLLPIALMLVWSANAQPFEIPSPNVPADVEGLSPAITVRFGANEWADYNGDGNIDFVLLGRLPSTGVNTVPLFGDVFRSSPSTRFEPPPPLQVYSYFILRSIRPLWLAAADWGDVDRDGDLDLVTIGSSTTDPLTPVTLVYLSGGNTMTESGTVLPGLHSGDVDWGDYDNDGDIDLVANGADATGAPRTLLLRNDGSGGLVEVDLGLVSLAYGSSSWVDYDNDADLDLMLTGQTSEGGLRSVLYRNDGNSFTESAASFEGLVFSTQDWGDLDGDGDLDLLLTGQRLSPAYGSGVTSVYRNDGGNFSLVPAGLPGVYYGEGMWVDYDVDGDLDVVLAGRREAFGSNTMRACIQEADVTFTCAQIQVVGLGGQPVPGLGYGSVSLADYDKDNDLDLFVTGGLTSGASVTTFYRSVALAKNIPPLAPSGLSSSQSGLAVTLAWNPAIDPNTPSTSLTYEVRVGTTPGGVDVVSPRANPDTGLRRIVDNGSAGQSRTYRLEGLPPGTYFWSVQAVDNSFAGSPFAPEESFTIGG